MKLIRQKSSLSVEIFELPQPSNYNEMVKSADGLFAEMLIRYHAAKNS